MRYAIHSEKRVSLLKVVRLAHSCSFNQKLPIAYTLDYLKYMPVRILFSTKLVANL